MVIDIDILWKKLAQCMLTSWLCYLHDNLNIHEISFENQILIQTVDKNILESHSGWKSLTDPNAFCTHASLLDTIKYF